MQKLKRKKKSEASMSPVCAIGLLPLECVEMIGFFLFSPVKYKVILETKDNEFNLMWKKLKPNIHSLKFSSDPSWPGPLKGDSGIWLVVHDWSGILWIAERRREKVIRLHSLQSCWFATYQSITPLSITTYIVRTLIIHYNDNNNMINLSSLKDSFKGC